MPRRTIADLARELLAEHRAMTSEALGEVVRERGLTRSASPAQAVSRALNERPEFRRISDGRWAIAAQLLDGAVLTHVVTGAELAARSLALGPDLAPLTALAYDHPTTTSGQPLRFAWDDHAREIAGQDVDAALVGPDGWLALAPGDLAHVRIAGSQVEVRAGPRPRPASRVTVRRLGEAARSRLDAQGGGFDALPPVVGIEALVLDLLADDPGLLGDPLPPLGEALRAVGLEAHRRFVGLPGTDWQAVDEFFELDDEDEGALLDTLAEELDLTPVEAEAVRLVLWAYELGRLRGEPTDASVAADLPRLVAVPGVARALARLGPEEPGIEPFIASIEAYAVGHEAAAPRFILASIAEARDAIDNAEILYRAAVAADPGFQLALIELARYETDRGDYGSALRRLREAGLPAHDPERAWLEERVGPAYRNVGRNEPCPCGSGRKFKVCHLGQPATSAHVRPAEALIHKLWLWQTQPDLERRREDLLDRALASVRGPTAAGAERDDAEDDAEDEDDPPYTDFLTGDIVLFDQGQLARFLDVRGELLPPGERDLGRSWLDTRRSLFEVLAVRPGTGVTLRDLRDPGDVVELADRSMSRQLEALDILCTRLQPDGEGGVTVAGGILVPRPGRREVLALLERNDPESLLAWLVTPKGPPTLQNAEGEPLVLVTATYRLPYPDATARALARTLEADGERFLELHEVGDERLVRGSIAIDGDHATIDANSVRRAERLERTLRKAAPGVKRLAREVRPAADLFAEAAADRRAGRTRAADTDRVDPATDPAAARVLDAYLREREARWVDESIPALGGLTPREALADPAMRIELDALLDDMAWQERGSTAHSMSADRIRAILGLPERRPG